MDSRMGTGQHGGSQVGGGRQDVSAHQHTLHDSPMQVGIIPPCPPVAAVNGTLHRRQQGTGSTGKVGHFQGQNSVPVRPVQIQPGDRQFRQQTGR